MAITGWQHPTGVAPEMVHLVALGRSACLDWTAYQMQKDRDVSEDLGSEVWTVNRGVRLFCSDLCFVLDDVRREMRLDESYALALRKYPNPIISTSYDGSLRASRVYPAAGILDTLGITGDPYWHNSIPMILAYALAIGVKRLALWGADYVLPDGRVMEANRANCEYWVGYCKARGMRVGVSPSATLLNQAASGGAVQVYGLVDQSRAPGFLRGELVSADVPSPEALEGEAETGQTYGGIEAFVNTYREGTL